MKNKKGLVILLSVISLFVCILVVCIGKNSTRTDINVNTETTQNAEEKELSYIEESNNISAELNYVSAEDVPVTFFWRDIQYADNESIIAYLKEMGVSEITIPIPWGLIESEKGVYDFSAFDEKLDLYVDAGFKFVFVLDTGGRVLLDGNQNQIGNSIPEWVWNDGGTKYADFNNSIDGQRCFDFADLSNIKLISNFYDVTIEHLSDNYGDYILGFAPGIMWEFELKMPQIGFAWSTYTEIALDKFQKYLAEKYITIETLNNECGTTYSAWEEIAFPVINYNNSILASALTDDPLYVDFMEYREQLIVDFVTPLCDIIHESDYQTYGYFCQVLHPHDGIYASGVVTELADVIDVAVIDYNFYDGYDLVLDSIIPATMTNYVKNLGYDEVYAGIYLERMDDLQYHEFIQETLDYVSMCGLVDGYEMGGLSSTTKPYEFNLYQRHNDADIAIYVSELNFYKDHGESKEYINYFTDSVAQMYKIIQFELGYDVDIISDDAVLNGTINEYELVVLAGQYYVDSEVKELICRYAEDGGKLLQDIRFGEYDEYGVNTGDWADDVFGITGRAGVVDSLDLSWNSNMQMSSLGEIRPYAQAISTCFSIVSDGEGEYLFSDYAGNQYGISNENAIILCWQPQMMYKYAITVEEQEYAIQVIDAVIEDLIN